MTKKFVDPFRFRAPTPDRPTVIYVDKPKLYDAMCVHHMMVHKALKEGTEPPRVSEYIGECIVKICEGLGNAPNFRNYTFVEEMVQDAILVCLKRCNSFDPTHAKKNAFGYFSRCAFFEMVNRIKSEKSYISGKMKFIRNLSIDVAAYQDHDDPHNNAFIQYLQEEADIASRDAEHEKQYAEPEEEIPQEENDMEIAVTKAQERLGHLDFL
jgi:DNA-directed RNA polymerase specialized sigma24 family protein